MTDVPDSSGQMPRRPRVSDGTAPVTGGLAIVLAVVAVVAGFLILRSISDSGAESADFPAQAGTGESTGSETSGTTVPSNTAPTLPTTTTVPPIVTEGASVIVANANGLGGSAGGMTRALETGAGFTMVDPTDASSTVGTLELSVIYFEPSNPNAQPVAESVGRVLGGVSTIAPLPDGTPPTVDGELNGADVLLMLGLDKANKTLEELNPDLATGGVSTVTNPDPTGTTTTTVASG